MPIIDLVFSFYHLAMRAVSLALSDPEFEADWTIFEQNLAALGVEIPLNAPPAAPVPSGSPQPVSRPSPVSAASAGVIKNADGSLSLDEG